jgi:hypothetical protein
VGSKASETSVSGQFIQLIQKGYNALAPEWQAEVVNFIRTCQHPEGGFVNRAGKPDLYYSIFGAWLSQSLEIEDVLENHKKFISGIEAEQKNTIDFFSLILIRTLLFGANSKRISLVKLFWVSIFENSQISLFYRLFLLMLIVDARYGSKLIMYPARPVLSFFSLPDDSPCSIIAAVLVVRHKVKLNTDKAKRVLKAHFEEGKGFKTYLSVREADLLSTAVALFALKNTGSDLRFMAPDCLDFIQKCYSEGAFLAGNGDEKRDLEYTFYGLLALGSLI